MASDCVNYNQALCPRKTSMMYSIIVQVLRNASLHLKICFYLQVIVGLQDTITNLSGMRCGFRN